MRVVENLLNLVQLIRGYEEVIVFPVGGEGQRLLEWLRYTAERGDICCIAATEVIGGIAQNFANELPIIPFQNLVHFRETALLIVAAPEDAYAQLDAELTRADWKMVVFVGNEVYTQIGGELQNFYNSGQVLMWHMQHLESKISEFEGRIFEQNKICDLHKETFGKYRNIFRGKRVVLVGCGPTLSFYRPIPGAVHIALNRSWMRDDIVWDYLFTHDRVISDEPIEKRVSTGFDRIRERIFIGKRIGIYPRPNLPESTFLREKISMYYLDEWPLSQTIYQDICYHPLLCFGSISFAALSFALFTFAKEIYLVGCDTSHKNHFYDADPQKDVPGLGVFFNKVGYARFKMFAREYYPETQIISVNPVGLRGLFRDVYTEEYQTALAQEKRGGG